MHYFNTFSASKIENNKNKQVTLFFNSLKDIFFFTFIIKKIRLYDSYEENESLSVFTTVKALRYPIGAMIYAVESLKREEFLLIA